MPKLRIKIGDKLNKLELISFLEKGKNGVSWGLFKCDCGATKKIRCTKVFTGKSRSCGCVGREVTRQRNFKRRSPTPTLCVTSPVVGIRTAMKSRCYNPNNQDYKNYGARGISVCEEWRKSLQSFHDWAMRNGYAKGLQVDRIDVNGNYEPGNCRFVTNKVNANNKRNNIYVEYNGEKVTLKNLCERLDVKYCTAVLRYTKLGMSLHDSLFAKKWSMRPNSLQKM